jgi:hypothetical protein
MGKTPYILFGKPFATLKNVMPDSLGSFTAALGGGVPSTLNRVMQMQTTVRANGSASSVKTQTQTMATAGSVVAAPADGTPVLRSAQLEAQCRNAMDLPLKPRLTLEPRLTMWAGFEIEVVVALFYMADVIAENEAAFLEYFLSQSEAPDYVMNLTTLRVAKILAARAVDCPGPEWFEWTNGKMSFPSLPGLLGRSFVPVLEVTEYIAWLIVDARQVIEEKIIASMKDRTKALRLAEALVLAQAKLYVDGHDEGDGHDEEKRRSGQLLAKRLLGEVLLCDGVKK